MARYRTTHKYGAKPTVVDGIRFASQAEARRFAELKLLEKAGEIRDLKIQPSFELWTPFRHWSNSIADTYQRVVGKYRADFSYFTRDTFVVEDVKGYKTELYRWKKKHFEAQYGIEIQEIGRK